jgi:multidrug efflux pump subunit AcrA (membrane-fusion protein)
MSTQTLETKKQKALQQAAKAQAELEKVEAELVAAAAKAKKEQQEKRVAEQLAARSQAELVLIEYLPELAAASAAMLASWAQAKKLARAAGVSTPDRIDRLMLPLGFINQAQKPQFCHSWMYPVCPAHKAALDALGEVTK